MPLEQCSIDTRNFLRFSKNAQLKARTSFRSILIENMRCMRPIVFERLADAGLSEGG